MNSINRYLVTFKKKHKGHAFFMFHNKDIAIRFAAGACEANRTNDLSEYIDEWGLMPFLLTFSNKNTQILLVNHQDDLKIDDLQVLDFRVKYTPYNAKGISKESLNDSWLLSPFLKGKEKIEMAGLTDKFPEMQFWTN